MPNVSRYSARVLSYLINVWKFQDPHSLTSWKVVVVGLSHTDKENDPPMTLASNLTNILLEYHHFAERQADVLNKTTQWVAYRQKVTHRSGRLSQQEKVWDIISGTQETSIISIEMEKEKESVERAQKNQENKREKDEKEKWKLAAKKEILNMRAYDQLQKEQQLVDDLSWRKAQSRTERRENAVKKRDWWIEKKTEQSVITFKKKIGPLRPDENRVQQGKEISAKLAFEIQWQQKKEWRREVWNSKNEQIPERLKWAAKKRKPVREGHVCPRKEKERIRKERKFDQTEGKCDGKEREASEKKRGCIRF